MRYGLAAIALLNLAAIRSAALAQDVPSQTIARENEALVTLFADCVTAQKSRRSAVKAFLSTNPADAGFYEASMKAADLHCLDAAATREHAGIQMKFKPDTFRDALYPSLYRRDYGRKGPVAGLSNLPPMRLADEFGGSADQLPLEYTAGRLFGDCVARNDPQNAHALLTAKAYTLQEDAAIDQLRPAFASCIRKDQTLALTRSAVRATVGEAMYKLSEAASHTS